MYIFVIIKIIMDFENNQKLYQPELLNSNNKICQPKLLNIELKEHQKTIIYKMNEIEKDGFFTVNKNNIEYIVETNIGIIGDRVGSGKSYMVLGLIAHKLKIENNYPIIKKSNNFICKKKKYINICSTNLIIVPYILINQWIEYLKNTKLKFVKFNKKKDIINFQENKNIEDFDVALISSNFCDKFFEKFGDNITWNRIFIDEVDTITIKNFVSQWFKANFIWGITATYNNLKWNYKSIPNFLYGKSTERNSILNYIIIKNNDQFINDSLKLPNIIRNNILCKSPYELNIISKFIPAHILEMINAGNTDEAIKLLNFNVDTNQNIIEIVTKKIKIDIDNNNIKLNGLYQMNVINQEEHNKKIENLKIKIQRLENRLKNIIDKLNGIDNDLCSICISEMDKPVLLNCECKSVYCFECIISWLDKKNNCPNCRSIITKDHINIIDNSQSNQEDKKEEKKEEIKEKIDELINIIQNKKDGKFLIFSNYYKTFDLIIKKLNNNNISNSVVNGTTNRITKLQNDFKNGKIKVLMLNAQYNGSGLNLQETTDIILYHKFNKFSEEQIIGRANRMGRNDVLYVHQLLYNNERTVNANYTYD